MSSLHGGDELIDPLLREAGPSSAPARSSVTRGKRKSRSSSTAGRLAKGVGVGVGEGPFVAGVEEGTGRRTSKRLSAVQKEDDEPSRGEEANLIQSPWEKETHTQDINGEGSRVLTKKAKRDSLEVPWQHHAAAESSKQRVASYSGLPKATYPYGLTPFRFPCLHHDQPSPPPGDPSDPHFKRYDPLEQLRQPLTSTTPRPADTANAAPPRHPPDRSTTLDSASTELHTAAPVKTDEEMASDAYESLQALLAASEDPNLTSIGGVDFDSFALLGEPGSGL